MFYKIVSFPYGVTCSEALLDHDVYFTSHLYPPSFYAQPHSSWWPHTWSAHSVDASRRRKLFQAVSGCTKTTCMSVCLEQRRLVHLRLFNFSYQASLLAVFDLGQVTWKKDGAPPGWDQVASPQVMRVVTKSSKLGKVVAS